MIIIGILFTAVGFFGLGFMFAMWAIMGWAWSSVTGNDES